MKNKRRTKFKKLISLTLVIAMVLGLMPEGTIFDLPGFLGTHFSGRVYACTTQTLTDYEISSLNDLITLSAMSPSDYQYYNLKFTTVISDQITEAAYTPLGSDAYPFKGKITVTQTAGNAVPFVSDVPLFNVICDSVEIVNTTTGSAPTISFHRSLSGDSITGYPLFANKVVHDTDTGSTPSTSWIFEAAAYYDSVNASTYYYPNGGVIGTVGTEAGDSTIVNLAFANNVGSGTDGVFKIYSSTGNVGMICGTINKNSTVNVTLSGTCTAYATQSVAGSAGRFAGSMQEGSQLNVKDTTTGAAFLNNTGSVTSTAYSGGIVGYCQKGTVAFKDSSDADLSLVGRGQIITGTTGSCAAGGLFGYYENGSAVTFDLTSSTINCTLTGRNLGGLFGSLVTNDDLTVKSGAVTATGVDAVVFGGICGTYSTSDSTKTFLVGGDTPASDAVTATLSCTFLSSETNTYYGGVTGYVTGSTYPYIKVNDFTHTSTAGYDTPKYFGGVIGTTNDTTGVADVGTFTLSTSGSFTGGGVIGRLNKGVLRLTGTTDLASARSKGSSTSYGQIVGERGDSLVYAVGNGTDSGWILNRYVTDDVWTDDIGTWGEVVRVSSDSVNTGTIYFNDTDHSVTIAAAETTMDSADDFMRTALNIQLNGGANAGLLKFADTNTSARANLLSTTLTIDGINGVIDLSGTGITGFTRDNGYGSNVFTGTLTGTNNAGIKLATGEYYGGNISDSALGKGHGEILGHNYNGLFGKTGAGAVISNIKLSSTGVLNVAPFTKECRVGGITAEADGGITLSGVESAEKINVKFLVAKQSHFVGGMIGEVGSVCAADVTFNSSSKVSPNITVSDNAYSSQYIGGAIGRVSSVNEIDIVFNTVTVSPTISSNITSQSAGLIANIAANSGSDTRDVRFSGVTVSGASLTECSGGLLGYFWGNTNVDFPASALTVSGTNTISSTKTDLGGLVYQATGHWEIAATGITISGLNVSSGGADSFGLLVHSGYSGTTDGIYLDLLATNSLVLAATGVTVPSTSDDDKYDELVYRTGSDVLANGCGIISITTNDSGVYSMDKSTCNSYANTYNTGTTNKNSRYYYNVTAHKSDDTAGSKWALLNWSLYRYAAGNIKSNFANPTLSGTYDMMNVSYYPVDISGSETIGNNITVKFYNSDIETTEALGTEKRKTGNPATQHYLMHSGLFRNVTGTLTLSGSVTLQGSVGVDITSKTTYTGALVCGTVSGSLITNGIVLDNVALNTTDRDSTFLLINGISGDNQTITIQNVSTLNYPRTNTATVASSLIGNVSGTYMNLKFDGIKLDGRSEANVVTNLNSAYNTSRSIFKNATLINSLDIDSNSNAIYNFTFDEDWGTGTPHGVTYGQEISESVAYKDEQKRYSGDKRYFVDPATQPTSTSGEYSGFKDNFLPYVRNFKVTSGYTYTVHELKVNVFLTGFTTGCGTYNHPYVFSESLNLVELAKVLNSDSSITVGTKFRLPKTVWTAAANNHWCEGTTGCAEYTYDGKNFTSAETGAAQWSVTNVRLYLAGAYYQITSDITIQAADKFIGLGSSTDTSGNYAFRGVIVGKADENEGYTNGKYPTITNQTKQAAVNGGNYRNTMGLVSISNGCVVKDINIVVDNTYTNTNIDTPNHDNNYDYRANGNVAYSYDEKFPNYGAVINKIMGGDNIIDNVTVTFNNDFKVFKEGNDYKDTVGGYVGCVVNGGLIFRNIADSDLSNFKVIRVNEKGQTQSANYTGDNDMVVDVDSEKYGLASGIDFKHFYINRFVGRVINGYVVNETDHYAFSEDGKYAFASDGISAGGVRTSTVTDIVSLHNSRKNYTIPDINGATINGTATYKQLEFSQVGGDTYNKVTIPDAQSFAILSMLTQSGSCGAESEKGAYKYNVSYCGSNGLVTGLDQKSNYKATHLSDYEGVGTVTSTSDASYTASLGDTVNSTSCVPYIISKYTQSIDGVGYPARCLTGRTFHIELSGDDTTFYLPDSFRGIGIIGLDAGHATQLYDLSMKVFSFDGNGNVINMNSFLPMYGKGNDPYYSQNTKNNVLTGLGLFNRLFMRGEHDSNQTTDAKYTETYIVKGFRLSGFLSAIGYTIAGKKVFPTNDYSSSYSNYYSTGGLVAFHSEYDRNNARFYNFANIDFDDLTIDSTGCAGAVCPFIMDGMIFLNNCNADNLTVMGGGRTGGFIGTADGSQSGFISGLHINANVDAAKTVLKNISIIQYRIDKDDNRSQYVGGIIGSYWGHQIPGFKKSNNVVTGNIDAYGNLSSFIFNNITITSDNETGSYIGNEKSYGKVGGIIGNDERSMGCVISNCKIEKTNIQGAVTGGILGSTHLDLQSGSAAEDYARFRVVNCEVSGDTDNDGNPLYTIIGDRYAGGVVGYDGDDKTDFSPIFHNQTYKYKIDGCYVHDYNITMTAVNSYSTKTFGAAGILGGSLVNNSAIVNSKVENCVITDETTQDERGLGGIIGYASKNNGLLGFNIVITDNTLQNKAMTDADTKIGNLIGYANSDTFNIQIAGYSRKDNSQITGETTDDVTYDIGRSSGTDQLPSGYTGSYLIYADFTGQSFNKTWSFDDEDNSPVSTILKSGVTNVTSMGSAPYATVLPKTSMGTTAILTGDGAYLKSGSSLSDRFVARAILDCVTAEGYGVYSDDDKTAVEALIEPSANANIKLSTYAAEMDSAPGGNDFPVLVISDSSDYSSAVRSYIRVLTNTSDNYFGENITGVDDSSNNLQYSIDILACQYTNGNYSVNAEATPGLSYNSVNKELRMNVANADSNQPNNQITVLDVKFYDPAYRSSNEIAYHLYIPVLTKKMIKFDFSSAVLSGTDYLSTEYTSKFGDNGVENFDNWFTMYVRFSYPASELQEIVDTGNGLYWNSPKKVALTYSMTDTVANTTKFVIVDPNGNSDKAYYALKSGDAVTTTIVNSLGVDTLDFSKFEATDETTMTPANVNDLTVVTYATSEEGIYAETNNPSEACIYAYAAPAEGSSVDTSTIKYFKKASDSDTTKFALTVTTAAVEDYYISMVATETDNTNKAYEFGIDTPRTLSGTYMSLINTKTIATEILGDIFKQTVELTALNPTVKMSTSNNELTATVTSTISFIDSENVNYVKAKFISNNFELHQGFVLRLNRLDRNGSADSDQQIHGGPGGTINGGTSTQLAEGAAYIASDPTTVTVQNKDGWSQTTTAVYDITFPANDDVLEDEFTARSSGTDQNGIYISASSNLVYSTQGASVSNSSIVYSSKSKSVDNRTLVYYMSRDQKAYLTLTAVSKLDTYDKYGLQSDNYSSLGINALYLEGDQYETVLADVVFDLSEYKDISAANKVDFSLTLGQKNDNGGNYGAYGNVDINTYLHNIKFFNLSGDEIGEFTSTNSNKLEFTKNASDEWTATYGGENVELDYDEDAMAFYATLSFDVLTGTDLEAISGYLYANYKINMTANLKTNDALFSTNSYGNDHLVYTNAKVNAEFVTGTGE